MGKIIFCFTLGLCVSILAGANSVVEDKNHSSKNQSDKLKVFFIDQESKAEPFFHFNFGKYKITALSDGYITLDSTIFNQNLPEQQLEQIQKQFFKNTKVNMPVNAFLIADGKDLTLIDSGAGACIADGKAGHLAQNIVLAGYQLNQIKTIFLTHLHRDHVCGLSQQGKKVFPNAMIYVSENEANYWLNDQTLASLEQHQRQQYLDNSEQIRIALKPYRSTDQFKTFRSAANINGIDVIPISGHSLGHYGFQIVQGQQKMVFVGDLVHSNLAQFAYPKLSVSFDHDPILAALTREKLFKQFADQNSIVAAAHLPFPGIGSVKSIANHQYLWLGLTSKP